MRNNNQFVRTIHNEYMFQEHQVILDFPNVNLKYMLQAPIKSFDNNLMWICVGAPSSLIHVMVIKVLTYGSTMATLTPIILFSKMLNFFFN
jgi:hypothetical protein